MRAPKNNTKIRLIVFSIILFIVIILMIYRIGYWQIVRGKELKTEAFTQHTSDQIVTPNRGVIYDRNFKKLAANMTLKTVEAIPQYIEESDRKDYSKRISEILDMDEETVFNLISSDKTYVVIKKWVDIETAQRLELEKFRGIMIVDDTKRYYPFDNLGVHIIGNTNVDNMGQYGVEQVYNDELTGTPGRSIRFLDGKTGYSLPYIDGKLYNSEDGLNVVLTIDETIQHYSEKLASEALKEYSAKRISILVMDPKTGELLAMTSKPDYNPNDRTTMLYDTKTPWKTLTDEELEKINSVPWNEKENDIYKMWKSFNVNENYEPGSTFKLITTAAALEESKVNLTEKFYCDGFATQIKGANIKCWSYLNPHGEENLAEAIQNSCNEVLVELALRLKKEKLYDYIRLFGFGDRTDIDLPGEDYGIVTTPKNINDVELATISFGQGINVTPIQLVTAISSFGNDGYLMKPRVVKKLVDKDKNDVITYEPEKVRQVVSEQTAHTMLDIMESVVTEGTGKNAYSQMYSIGGKTGTAQKIINGKYDDYKYIASFAAIAPIEDPKLTVLVIVDEPGNGITYGGTLAAPIAKEIIEKSLNYMNVDKSIK